MKLKLSLKIGLASLAIGLVLLPALVAMSARAQNVMPRGTQDTAPSGRVLQTTDPILNDPSVPTTNVAPEDIPPDPNAGSAILRCAEIGPLCVIDFIVSGIAYVFNGFFHIVILWFVGPFIEVVVSIRTYEDRFAEVIYPEWLIFRNLGNIFF